MLILKQTVFCPLPAPLLRSDNSLHLSQMPSIIPSKIICKKPDDWDEWKTIHFAAKGGFVEDVNEFLEKDPDSRNSVDFYGNTPLYYACLCGHYDVAQILLDLGAKDIQKRGYLAALTEDIRHLLYRYHKDEWREDDEEQDEDKWVEPSLSTIWQNFSECMLSNVNSTPLSMENEALNTKLRAQSSWVDLECPSVEDWNHHSSSDSTAEPSLTENVDLDHRNTKTIGCFWNVLFFHWKWLLIYFIEEAEERHLLHPEEQDASSDDSSIPSPVISLSLIKQLSKKYDTLSKKKIAQTSPDDSSSSSAESSSFNIPKFIETHRPLISRLPKKIIFTDIDSLTLSYLIKYMMTEEEPLLNLSEAQGQRAADQLLYTSHCLGMLPLFISIVRMLAFYDFQQEKIYRQRKRMDENASPPTKMSTLMSSWEHYPSMQKAIKLFNTLQKIPRKKVSKLIKDVHSAQPPLHRDYFSNLCFVEGPSMFTGNPQSRKKSEPQLPLDILSLKKRLVLYLLCDTKLTGTGTSAVYCHKYMICEKSPFFNLCLDGGFSESFKSNDQAIVSIPFPDVPDDILVQTCTWLYKEQYRFTRENAVETLMLADRLQLNFLFQKTIHYLIKKFTNDLPYLLEVAEMINSDSLKHQTLIQLIKNTNKRSLGFIMMSLRDKIPSHSLLEVHKLCLERTDLCMEVYEAKKVCMVCNKDRLWHFPSLHFEFSCCHQICGRNCLNDVYLKLPGCTRAECITCRENRLLEEALEEEAYQKEELEKLH